MHLHGVVALFAQHVNDFAHKVLRVLRRPLRDLHHRFLSCLAALQLLLRYQDVLHEEVALGVQEGIVLLHLQDAHGLVVLALQDFRDDGLLDVVLPARHHRHAHAVTAHGEHRVALTDEDGLAPVVGQERVLAVGLAHESAFLHLRLQVQPVAGVVHLAHIVVPSHLLKHVDSQHLRRMGV